MTELFTAEFLTSLDIVDWGRTTEMQPQSFTQFSQWVQSGGHGQLNYLADHRQHLRSDLRHVFPPCQSALVFLFSYARSQWRWQSFWSQPQNLFRLAGYVLGFAGKDYHVSLGEKLQQISLHLKTQFPTLETKIILDVHPVLERDLAYRSGLGWFGKNSMLINRKHGSFFMIGSILLSEDILVPSSPRPRPRPQLESDHCGQCRRCVDACPTQAIDETTRSITSSLCISSFTIEEFKPAPLPSGIEKSRGEIFGCDICQDVCPWNQKLFRQWDLEAGEKEHEHELMHEEAKNHPLLAQIIQFFLQRPKEELWEELGNLSNRQYRQKFLHTALARTGRIGIMKNIAAYLFPSDKKDNDKNEENSSHSL